MEVDTASLRLIGAAVKINMDVLLDIIRWTLQLNKMEICNLTSDIRYARVDINIQQDRLDS